jgi:SAM-dependent methyltransferase
MVFPNHSNAMNSFFWYIRNILANKSRNPKWYNGIQNFFGAHNMWSQFVQKYLPSEQPYRILDLGCGTANILQYLPHNAQYVGVDTHKPYIDSCLQRYSKRGAFICSDWNIEFPMDNVDVVLLLGLLHHLPDADAKNVIALALRHLKPGGKVITLDNCREEERSRFEDFFYKIDRGNFIRSAAQLKALFPHSPSVTIHDEWLRVPYKYAVCCCWNN